MPINKDTVTKVSNLARIKIDEKQLNTVSSELDSVMEWIDTLNEVNTDGVDPVANVTGQKLPKEKIK